MFKYVHNKKGSALAVVIIVMAVGMILGVTLLSVSLAETRFAARQEDKMQAHYIARSGAEAVAKYMIGDPGEAKAIVGKNSLENSQLAGGTFTIDITENLANNTVTIASTGVFNGVSQIASIRLSRSNEGLGGIFQYAIAAKEGISVANKAGSGIEIEGDIATKSGTIDLGNHGTSGDQVYDEDLIFPPIVEPPDRADDADPPKADYDLILGGITGDVTFDSDSIRYVRADYIDIKGTQEKKISVTGSGEIHLYVDGDVYMDTKAEFNVSPNAKLYIYVIGERQVVFKGSGTQNNVLIYAPDSDIEWNNAQGNDFFGALYGKTVKIHNHANVTHNPELAEGIEIDDSGVGPTYTGYVWVD